MAKKKKTSGTNKRKSKFLDRRHAAVEQRKQSKTSQSYSELLEPGDDIDISTSTQNDLIPGNDSTELIKFSFEKNTKFSGEIIKDVEKGYGLKRLQRLGTKKNLDRFYGEAKEQVIKLCNGIAALTVHNDLFTTILHIKMGHTLNEIEKSFGKKGKYVLWIKESFEGRHIRYFQEAKQLANMGPFAWNYAAMGKKRLLMLEALRKDHGLQSCEDLFKDHPFPAKVIESMEKQHPYKDLTEDYDGVLMKSHADALGTYRRLQDTGVSVASFTQATLIASFNKKAIGVKSASTIKSWLDILPEKERKKAFSAMVMDKTTTPPRDSPPRAPVQESLNKILGDFVEFCNKGDLENVDWLKSQKEILHTDTILEAHRLIDLLLAKMEIAPPNKGIPYPSK